MAFFDFNEPVTFPDPTSATPLSPTLLPPPTSTPIATPGTQTTHPPGRTQYTLSATLSEDWQRLVVSQTIHYVNLSPQPLTELLLLIEPARLPGVFTLQEIHWADGQPVINDELVGTRLHLPLARPLAPQAAAGLQLAYSLLIPEQAGPFGRTPRQLNLGDWYPFVPPYQAGQGWLAHDPAEVGEHLAYETADYQVAIRLPPDSDLILVASAPAQVEGDWRHFSLTNGRSFAWSASPDYQLLSQPVGQPAGQTTVTAAVFPEHQEQGQLALDTTAQALLLYSRLFTPYPHDSLTIVEADFRDGMEYDGLYFLDAGLFTGSPPDLQGYLIPIAAHETAHQWWYGRVGSDPALEPWLDESLATYSELLFYESEYPELVQWWWDFRVNRLYPAGWVDSTIYEHHHFRSYVDAVYLRGARWLEQLRLLLGDARFLAFLEVYAQHFEGQQANGEAFWALLEGYDPAGVAALRQAYFRPTD